MIRRMFIIVLDSFGIGAMPDAAAYGDEGSNTLAAVAGSSRFFAPHLAGLGLFNIDGVTAGEPAPAPDGCFARLTEQSRGKDTTIGHWEIAGIVSDKPLPTFPDGFPPDIIARYETAIGRKTLCNKAYSGTKVLEDYGLRHVETGDLIVYTSADSVFQVAAHEAVVPVEQLYEYCAAAREIMTGDYGVGRIIARPFTGDYPHFTRMVNRHDFSLEPPGVTMLDILSQNGLDTIGVGKIFDIFAGRGISRTVRTKGNRDGMEQTIRMQGEDFHGLCFVNLVDFDMLYGHRNDIDGYAAAISEADALIGRFLQGMRAEDVLMITADHGCDPSTESTDHSREYVPLLLAGAGLKKGVNLATRHSFADIAATVCDAFGAPGPAFGESFLEQIRK